VQDDELSADPSLAEEENQHQRRDFIMKRLDAWALYKNGIGWTRRSDCTFQHRQSPHRLIWLTIRNWWRADS
jgi:hypothetical protein